VSIHQNIPYWSPNFGSQLDVFLRHYEWNLCESKEEERRKKDKKGIQTRSIRRRKRKSRHLGPG